MPLTPSQAFVLLLQNPEGFLMTYPCKSFGVTRASSEMDYHIETRGPALRPGTILRTRRFHPTTAFNLKSGRGFGDAYPFRAHMISLQPSSDALHLYEVPADGADVLVTGALTGCAFVVEARPGGRIACAHVQPSAGAHTGEETGEELHDRLVREGHDAVYGKRAYNHRDPRGNIDREVSVIGVRKDGSWQIFAQKLEPTNQYAIRSVHKIYP